MLKPTADLLVISNINFGDSYEELIELNGYEKMDVIDHLHPVHRKELLLKQIQQVNEGKKIAVITNNDIVASEINNLICLFKSNNKELMKELGYTENVLINPDNVEAYELNNQKLVKAFIGEYGIIFEWMNLLLEDLYDRTLKIQDSLSV